MGTRHPAAFCSTSWGHRGPITPPISSPAQSHHPRLPFSRAGVPQPTDTASTPQYPRGTIASGLPDPETLLTPSNQEQLPDDDGICKSLISMSWAAAAAPGRPPQEAAEGGPRGTPGVVGRTVRVKSSWPLKRHTTTSVFPLSQGPEDQEAATPEIRPCSLESAALAATVQQRTQV
ncbi:hypothetical protein NDU88_003820 [Pleurodeles waltl]|uniref:Uncharacterized protein n=1 Tax=Pleurodeles waltl TaxID=8319 RepID=A0AAV7TQT4_PLEWA|nr:hypothetical protein NDU88_003820 [Pleurodeles waltl]